MPFSFGAFGAPHAKKTDDFASHSWPTSVMGKTSEREQSTSTSSNHPLRYRPKALVPQKTREQPQATASKRDESQPELLRRSKRPSTGRRVRPMSRYSKQAPRLLQQRLWKAKAVQPTPRTLTSQHSSNGKENAATVAFGNVVEPLGRTTGKTVGERKPSSLSEAFAAGSSSQETQSGSEDDVVFLRYNDLRSAVQPSTKWRRNEEDADVMERDHGPGMPSQEEAATKQVEHAQAAATRRKQRQKYRLKQKLKRAGAKGYTRLQHQQKQPNERLRATKEDAGAVMQDGENATENHRHPSTNLTNGTDARLSQLKEVVPFIVVGDVACPVVADSDNQFGGAAASALDQRTASITGSKATIVRFRQHASTMRDRFKETPVQYRDSFVVENSDFDAASSYDFFKRRYCEIQRTTGIVYY